MKDYTKLFHSMYNIGIHVIKHHENIIHKKIRDFKYDDFIMELNYVDYNLITLYNTNYQVRLNIRKFNVEMSNLKCLRIHTKEDNDICTLQMLQIFNEEDEPLFRLKSSSTIIDFPFYNEDVFHLNLNNYPVLFNLNNLNNIKKNLELYPYDLYFYMDKIF